jgi:xyloglucan-specific exo-beta-1,4-glucanase
MPRLLPHGTLRPSRLRHSPMRRALPVAAGAALLAGLLAPSAAAAAQSARDGAPPAASAGPASAGSAVKYSWKNVQIVGGGFVDGFVFSPAQRGLAYARTDIGGAYRWDAAARRWVPLMDFTGFNDWNTLGVESIAADPASPRKVWVAAGEYTSAGNGEILRSGNQGRTWQIAQLPIPLASNQDGRNMGERLAVDPRDDRILYLASPANGLWRSTDGGAAWSQVASFPVTASPDDIGLSFVTFGSRGGHRGRPTSTIFVGNATDTGTNLYESTDAGATWQAVPGEPTGLMPQHGALAAGGTLYVDYSDHPGPNGMTDGSVWKYNITAGTWSNITPEVPGAGANPHFGYGGLAADPAHPGTVMVATNDRWFPVDDIYRSTDGGATWKSVSATATLDVSASPFLHWGAAPKFGWWIASVAIDPFDSAHVMYGTGATVFGSADVTALDSGGGTHWSSAAAEGIEETAVQDLLSPPAGPGHLVSALGDVGGFYHGTLTASPPGGMSSNPILGTGTSLDEAGLVPADVVRVGWSGGAWSSDDGQTWTPMTLPAGEPDGAGVTALSADGTTVLWAPEHYSWAPQPATPVYSTDHGQTWADVSGLPAGDMPVADPVDAGVFYAFDPATGNVLKSADGGVSFAPVATGLPAGVGAEETSSLPQLHTTPGRAGDLWLTSGSGVLYHSVDGGTTFSPVTSVATVATLGFGKAAPGARYPAIYLAGIVRGVQGVFRSVNEGATWTRINDSQHQYGWIGQTITGDPRVFGRVYLGTNGRGILLADPAGPGQ